MSTSSPNWFNEQFKDRITIDLQAFGGVLDGTGVVVAYDLDAYCPPARRGKAASPEISNTYRLVGRAFLVEDVDPGGNPYSIISSQDLSLIFSDRPLQ